MNDKFFNKRVCDRCGKDLSGGRIMSMYNEDCICMECKDKETKRLDYKEAVKRDMEEYLKRHKITYKISEKKDKKIRKLCYNACIHKECVSD